MVISRNSYFLKIIITVKDTDIFDPKPQPGVFPRVA